MLVLPMSLAIMPPPPDSTIKVDQVKRRASRFVPNYRAA